MSEFIPLRNVREREQCQQHQHPFMIFTAISEPLRYKILMQKPAHLVFVRQMRMEGRGQRGTGVCM